MDIQKILSHVDHTLLSPSATTDDIKALCDDAIKYHTASVCIPACYVREAKEYAGDRMKICTVIGFPLGYSSTAVKCFEASNAVENGADEIDMVINIGYLKSKRYGELENEISEVKKACRGRLLKVIIEACLLTDEEKIKMCEIVGRAGADFIKTSTGFSSGGATKEDVALFAKYVKAPLKIKAAGGISSIDDAEDFIRLGASRLGTSRIVKEVKAKEKQG